jgi:hypothetical protein
VSGTVSGNSISITLNENGQLVTFSGSVSSDCGFQGMGISVPK